jgi:hypothetical protein
MRAPVVAARIAKSLTCGIVHAAMNAETCSRVMRLSRGGDGAGSHIFGARSINRLFSAHLSADRRRLSSDHIVLSDRPRARRASM